MGVRFRVDRLNPSRIIDVRHRRDVRARHVEQIDPPQGLLGLGHGRAPRLDDGGHQQHVRTVGIHGEIVGDALPQDRGRKGPEGLAVFDLEVHHRLHLRAASIANDAPGAEGAWPKLHTPLKPTNDLLRSQFLGNVGIQLCIAHPHVWCVCSLEKLLNLGVTKCWPQEGALHPIPSSRLGEAGLLIELVPGCQCGPHGAPASPAAG